ncbi:MAG TPA: lamin tail domain-containing protein, partial [Anaerolineales bacterium]|nr:lamin tail domain-containing protein [Anaerolineales bacterium]
ADFGISSPSNPQNFFSPAVPCLAVVDVTSSLGTLPLGDTFDDTSGQIIDVQLVFSNIVDVTGSPTLLMETGTTDRVATYTSGSGTDTLNFVFTVGTGDNTSDLDYASVNALSLNGGTISGASGDAVLILPKPNEPGSGSLSDNADIRIDKTSTTPTLVSFKRQNPTGQYTKATNNTLVFRIAFSEAVTSIDTADFDVVDLSGILLAPTFSIANVEGGRVYDLTIKDTNLSVADGDISLNLNLVPGFIINDVNSVMLVLLEPGVDEKYTVDNTSPTINIEQSALQVDPVITPVNDLPINLDVVFDNPIDASTFTALDIKQNGSATGITWSITDSGDHKTFTLSAIASGSGTLVPSIDANKVKDLAGNDNLDSGNVGCLALEPNNCVTYNDTTLPTVTINQAVGQSDPTPTLPINFNLTFSEVINIPTFTTSDITQTGTATGVTWSLADSGDHKTFTLSATTASSLGTIIPSMAANRVTDLSGNNNIASTSIDNNVTYAIPPTSTPASTRSIVINEVAWAGTGSAPLSSDEWIELYNVGPSPVDLNGWKLKDSTTTINLTGVIPAHGYFLLEKDDNTTVSDIPADLIYTSMELSNSGETLTLYDATNKVIDTANGNGGSWPAGSSSTYGTMERVRTESNESDIDWATNTGVKRNGKNANGTNILGTPKSSNTPPPTATPTFTPTSTPTMTPTSTQSRSIIINEVAWAGTASGLADDEWIELYNSTSSSVNLSGWKLQSSEGTPSINLTGVIPAGGYFLLERDDDSTVSDIAANQIYTGGLSNSGETLILYDPSNRVIDTANGNGGSWAAGSSSTYGTMERVNITFEADSAWATNTGVKRNGKTATNGDILGTPKSSNTPAPTATPTRVRTPTATPIPPTAKIDPRPIINEILPRPGFDWNQDGRADVFDEFIEIKNLSPIDISLNGWKLDKVGSTAFSLPNVTLKPGQHIVFYSAETKLLLSDGGETVRLFNPSNKIFDAYTYNIARAEDKSICRLPDGNLNNGWEEDCTPTPGQTNTREGQVPSSPNGNNSSACDLPDTIPADFFYAECNAYGVDIWNPYYWDQLFPLDKRWIEQTTSKWKSFFE